MNRISLLFRGLLLAVSGCRTMGDTGVVVAVEELRLLNFEVRDGTTTRENLLLQLGAPDETWGESRVVYRWRKVVGEVGWIGLGANNTSPIPLEIEFNGQGEVTLVRLK